MAQIRLERPRVVLDQCPSSTDKPCCGKHDAKCESVALIRRAVRWPDVRFRGDCVAKLGCICQPGSSVSFCRAFVPLSQRGSCGIDASVPTPDAPAMPERPPPIAVGGKET